MFAKLVDFSELSKLLSVKSKVGFYLKTILKMIGIDRVVTVLNPLRRKEEKHPIY